MEFLTLVFDENGKYVDSHYWNFWAQRDYKLNDDGSWTVTQSIPVKKEYEKQAGDCRTELEKERKDDDYKTQIGGPCDAPKGVGGCVVEDGAMDGKSMPDSEKKALKEAAKKWNEDGTKTPITFDETTSTVKEGQAKK